MTEPAAPTPPLDELASMPSVSRGYQVSMVVRYIEVNRDRFTEDVLVRAARGRGYPEDVVEEARARARANERSAPARQRARRWIVAAYLLTFTVLTIGMHANRYAGEYWAVAYIGTGVLALTLGLALLVSLGWLAWLGPRIADHAPGMVLILTVPIVLLVTVAGLCVSTAFPVPRPS